MEMSWQDEHSHQSRLQYERNLNFSTLPEVLDDVNNHKKKMSRDPLSHRIIEKRRRDRMNNCLADLSRLIPSNFAKKSRGRIEKTEIIEMAIKHLKQLMFRASKHMDSTTTTAGQENSTDKEPVTQDTDRYCLGFQECMSETMYFLVEVDGFGPGEGLCMRLVNHLQKHLETIVKGPQDDRQSLDPQSVCLKSCKIDDQDDGSSPQFDRLTPPSSTGTSNSNTETDNYYSSNNKARTESGRSINDDIHMNDINITITESSQEKQCSAGIIPTSRRVSGGDENRTKNTEFGSQLREMLLLQNNTGRALSVRNYSSSPTTVDKTVANESPLGGGSSCHSVKSGSGDEVYKFKTDIKERFRADQRTTWNGNDDDDSRCESEIGTEFNESVNISGSKGASPSLHLRTSSEQNSKVKHMPTAGVISNTSNMVPTTHGVTDRNNCSLNSKSSCQEIPIFALHPKGNFYIPMILDGELLEPYISTVECSTAQTLLHHIGISVHFSSGTIRVPWSHSSVL